MGAARYMALAAALALTACSSGPSDGPISQCSAQSGLTARAAQAIKAGAREPVQANAAEAVAIDACLRNMGEPGITRTMTAGVYTPETGGAVVTGGTGYRGAELVKVTIAPPPASAKVAPPAKPGKLALPVEYPLLPGDAELWDTLTLAQQQRALLFLRDGSTIRASLRTE